MQKHAMNPTINRFRALVAYGMDDALTGAAALITIGSPTAA